jgi:hypothetical protein
VRSRLAASADAQADDDTIEQATITALIAEAEGTNNPHGEGYVPEADHPGYDVSPLPPSDPRLIELQPGRRGDRRRWAMAALVLLVGFGYLGTLWRSRQPARPAQAAPLATTAPPSGQAATPTPLGDLADDPAEVLRPTSLEIVRRVPGHPQGGRRYVLPVDPSEGALGAAWIPDLQPGRAAWLAGTTINAVLCLAPADAALVTEATARETLTLRIASGETRRYQAAAPRTVGRSEREVMDQRRAGLTLIVCGVAGNERTILEAALQLAVTHPGDQPGATAAPTTVEATAAPTTVETLTATVAER